MRSCKGNGVLLLTAAGLFAAIGFLTAPRAHPGEVIWVEGEAAKTQDVTRHPWWYDKVKKDELSGGDFISNFSKDKLGLVTYEVSAPAEHDYEFWVRANPLGKLSYALDAGDWVLIDSSKAVDSRNIAEDEKPDLRFIAWIKVGALKLSPGAHTLKFKMDSDINNHGMLDCFVLSEGPFTPRGKLKPGEKAAPAASAYAGSATEDGRWAFTPPKDEFSPDALLDLRGMNEKFAGESGFIRCSKDGSGFVLGNGKPVRFWAVGDGAERPSPHGSADLDQHARFLAKRGINMTRTGINIFSLKNLADINTNERELLWRHVAAMKKEGIYTIFVPIWIGASNLNPKLGFLDDGGNHDCGLLFYDKKLQEAYKGWMKQLMTEKNPYTGIPLAQDPALAIIQLQNEDSLLWYSGLSEKGAARKELRRQFGEFLVKKYATLDKAKEAWGGAEVGRDQDTPDDFANGEAALAGAWELTQRRGGDGFQKRLNDQYEFLCRTMYDFHKSMADYLKNELGCKQLINAGNWRTADNVMLLDGERWAQSANDVMAINRYNSPVHQGKLAGWAICKGDKFTNDSALLNPRTIPVTLKQVEGYPMLITEGLWVPPLGCQSEGPFLVSAYQSLNGVAGYFWNGTNDQAWTEWGLNSANGYVPDTQAKWLCATPMLMGQWPAAALLYRMGYVKRGEPAVSEQRKLEDIFSRGMPIIAEDEGYDPNRDTGLIARESNVKDGVDPLAYLVGPVLTKYGGDPAKSKVADLPKYIDKSKKIVKSNTNELELDYGNGLCKLNAPKAQGATGYLKQAGKITLGDMTIESANEYATVLAVALDDKPLNASANVLIQVGTSERTTGWTTRPVQIKDHNKNFNGEEIISTGKGPWQIVNADITITLNNPNLHTACVLDANGMKVKEIELPASGEEKSFKFPPDALYVVLK